MSLRSFFLNIFNRKREESAQAPEPSARISMTVVYEEGEEMLWETSSIPDRELAWSKSVCPYCGVGCGILVGAKDGKVHKVRGNPDHPANRGLLCAKGATLPQMLDTPDRLLWPQMRASRFQEFKQISWKETLGVISQKIKNTIDTHGPESVAFYISGQLLTEDYYVINKFAKGFLKTNNVDSNSRLCMASAVAGYTTSLGADGPPACYDDIEESDCFFLIGSNMAACHPVTFQRIKTRKAKNPGSVKVIVVDPRKTRTSEIADLFLPIRPGTDVALLNAMLHVMEKEGLLDKQFIEGHTSGWPALQEIIKNYPPEKAASICGLEEKAIREAALLFGRSPSALSFWSMGVNQSTSGLAKNNAIINLHLATGKIARPGCGPFSLTGQPNAMGGRETGGLAHLLPGHRSIANESHRREIERLWRVPEKTIHPKAGHSAVELFQAVGDGRVKIIWIIATNPMVSIPNLHLVRAALGKAELVIVQDPYHPTETSRLADILLPAAQWSERDGTVTNSERRISYLEKITDPPGEAKADWKIICELAQEMGFKEGFSFQSAEEVYEEYKKCRFGTHMDISGVSYKRLKNEFVQWPAPSETASTPRLYADHRFAAPDGRARFLAHEYKGPAESTDKEYPFILTTGRVRDQWHTMTRTGKIDSLLKSEPYAFIEINPDDAENLRIFDGDPIQVVTRRGRAKAPARVTKRVQPGVCFMPFHWGGLFGDAVVNQATSDAFDSVSKQPELKFSACRIEKVNERVYMS